MDLPLGECTALADELLDYKPGGVFYWRIRAKPSPPTAAPMSAPPPPSPSPSVAPECDLGAVKLTAYSDAACTKKEAEFDDAGSTLGQCTVTNTAGTLFVKAECYGAR